MKINAKQNKIHINSNGATGTKQSILQWQALAHLRVRTCPRIKGDFNGESFDTVQIQDMVLYPLNQLCLKLTDRMLSSRQYFGDP